MVESPENNVDDCTDRIFFFSGVYFFQRLHFKFVLEHLRPKSTS